MLHRTLSLLWLCLVALGSSAAAGPGAGPGSPGQEPVRAQLFARAVGEEVRAVLRLELEEHWHLYHDELGPEDAVGMPTRVSAELAGVQWDAPQFPEPTRFEQPGLGDGGADTWIYGHEELLLVRLSGRIAAGASPDPSDLQVRVDGLVCEDEGVCIPYRETLTVSGTGPDALFAAFPGAAPATQPVPPQTNAATVPSFAFGGAEQFARGALYVRSSGPQVEVAIELTIDDGWHLYHDDLGPDDAIGIPTTVELSAPGVRFGAVRFPPPERHEQPGIGRGGRDTWIQGHSGTIVLRAEGQLDPGATAPEAKDVRARLAGQTCEDLGRCVDYAEELRGSGPGPDALFAAATDRAATGGGGNDGEDGAAPAQSADGEGLGQFLGLAVLWGLFTLLMPCTYPMIPITISFFTKQAASRGGHVLPLALAYGVGIVAIFVAIGLLVGPSIIPFATDPWLNLGIGLLFLYFALVLFGVVNLNPPRFLLDAAGQASTRGGLVGVFLMGATLVVTSFTCTAPFVANLLSVGATGEGAGLGRIALGMAVFGLTIAVPFVFLSLVPGKISTLPRAGLWMNTLKVTLAFVELAAALKFLSNSDLVWDWQFLSRELFLLLWAGIFGAAALYLFGLVRLKGEGAEVGPGRLVAGLSFLLFAIYCGYGAGGRDLDPVLTAIAPPYSGRIAEGFVSASGGGPAAAQGHAVVVDDYEAARARALAENKLLLVNFTGHTCVNCRLMERRVFPSAEVAAQLGPHYVEARLHTDGEVNIERILELQQSLAQSIANPFYVLVDPQTGERLATSGSYSRPEVFAAFLSEGRRLAGRG
jgi:thiol:disulfide interchange protein/DsbC/DsbD-like thiol-disulfide interchange protein